MLSKGHKIIILAVIGLIVIIALFFILFDFNKSDDKQTAEDGGEIGGAAVKKEIQYETPQLTAAEIDQNNIKNQSMTFVERFATYSNQSVSSKIDELKPLMTDSFYSWATSQYVDSLAAEYDNGGDYASIVTNAIALEFVSYASDQSEVIVETKRVKGFVNSHVANYSQKIRLELIKVQGVWKVDGAYWLE